MVISSLIFGITAV